LYGRRYGDVSDLNVLLASVDDSAKELLDIISQHLKESAILTIFFLNMRFLKMENYG